VQHQRKIEKENVPIDFIGFKFKVDPNEKVHDLCDFTYGNKVRYVFQFVLLNTGKAVNRGVVSNKIKDHGFIEGFKARGFLFHCQVEELLK